MGKKIGIITMHKVLNYGSALQAYALQRVIEKMGYDVEIIDYIYPNEYHMQFVHRPCALRRLISYAIEMLRGFPRKRRIKAFEEFYKENLKLSRTYYSKEELHNNPPKYDVYMTGSDQVWNPKSIHEDPSFMLSFTDSSNKVAFSASIAKCDIPANLKELYANELKKYKQIYVREEHGSEIVNNLIGIKPKVVLDPTLLLESNEWKELAKKSKIKFNKPYILIYVLEYSFNVYPYMYDLIKYIQQQKGMELVVLGMSIKHAGKLSNKVIMHDASVYDFVKLFTDASLVITDSFHGTAFSLNLNIPFYSVINNIEKSDSRIADLLTMVDEKSRIIKKGDDYTKIKFNLLPPNNNQIHELREDSLIKLQGLI